MKTKKLYFTIVLLIVVMACGIMFINKNTAFAEENPYSLRYAEVMDDKAVEEGWYYYYTDKEGKTYSYEKKDRYYTTVELQMEVTNDTYHAIYVCGCYACLGIGVGDTVTYFSPQMYIHYPDKVDQQGFEVFYEKAPMGESILPGESLEISYRFDIDEDAYRIITGLYQAPEGVEIVQECTFNYDSTAQYIFDLTDEIQLASEFEFVEEIE